MTYIELSKNPDERVRQLQRESDKPATYITDKGERIEAVKPSIVERRELEKVCPHPMTGVSEVFPDDPFVVGKVTNEHGRILEGDDYRAALTALAKEKGWVVSWPKDKPKQKKRGRPPAKCAPCDGTGCEVCHGTGKRNWKRYVNG